MDLQQRTFVLLSTEELEAREKNLRDSILQEVQDLLNAAPNAKEFLTTEEVINQFGFSQSTLWRMEQNKTLVPHRSGRKKLFAVADIKKAIKIN